VSVASTSQKSRVSARAASPQKSLLGAAALLPRWDVPKIVTAAYDDVAKGAEPDALLAIVPDNPAEELFTDLPESERWQELNARSKPRSGTLRSTVLANRHQTQAVLGYVGATASPFERLSLAGRMLKETTPRRPQTIGLIALGENGAAREALSALLAAALAQAFQMPSFRAQTQDKSAIRRVVLLNTGTDRKARRKRPRASTRERLSDTGGNDGSLDIPYAIAAARGNNLARWLTALPPNLLDARGYRTAIAQLARRAGLGMRWLDERALRRLGANAFLAVSAGNDHSDAGIAHLTYRPSRARSAAPDVALIGKGILFDTGGVNLKTHRSMLDMHIDMAGSAVALASLLALVELRAPIAADAWLAITENRIGPNAYRPQEIVQAANGVTIQVIHTDAEGRMVLADTLALAGRTKPRFMLDFATLTGACVYSLTERMSGMLTNRQDLVPKLLEAGRTSGERVWNFPFDADYDTDLESKVADVLQCSVDGKGDQILATRFLSRFVPENTPWAHVDLSSALRSGGLGHINTDVTGFGVRYALELLLKHDILGELERGP